MKHFIVIACLLASLINDSYAKDKIVECPPFIAQSTSSIEIARIILSDTATIVKIKANYYPNYWIKIASGSFLRDNNGELYRLRYGLGITPDQEFWMPSSGEAEFQLVFPPLPKELTTIDFSEGDFEGSYKIWGVQLKGELPKLKLPKTEKTDKNKVLPTPKLKYSKAILKGTFLDYKKDMPQQCNLFLESPFSDEKPPINIKIEDNGTFQAEIELATVTLARLNCFSTSINCLIAPEEETNIQINLRELTRQQSRLHRNSKPYGSKVYFSGFMADLQQETANTNIKSVLNFDYDQLIKDIAGKDINQYKTYILSKAHAIKEEINNSTLSKAGKDKLNTELSLSIIDYLLTADYHVRQGYILKHNLKDEQAEEYYRNTKIEIPEGYYKIPQEYVPFNTPQALYCQRFAYTVLLMQYMDEEMISNVLGTNEGTIPDFIKIYAVYRSISDFNPLSAEQRAKIANLPGATAYLEMLEKENSRILAQIELNKKKSGFVINEVGEVSNENLFQSIISKYSGRTLLVDFWATWCGPCRSALQEMLPMKEELQDKDIVYVYLTGETSPKATWNNMITDIHGEHFRLTEAQWKYLGNKLQIEGVPTYFVIDKEGNTTYKVTGFPGRNKMKEELLKAIDK